MRKQWNSWKDDPAVKTQEFSEGTGKPGGQKYLPVLICQGECLSMFLNAFCFLRQSCMRERNDN